MVVMFAASAHAAGPVRIAIVMAEPGRDAEKSLLLAEVRLSEDADIALLDRQHIRSVLREQRLDARGLLATDRVLQLGRLLTAELLAVVEPDSQGGDGAGGLIVYHASSGLRLWDATLSSDGIEQCAQSICQGIRSAVRKLRAEDQEAVSVCILHLRNAELPSYWNPRVLILGKLLERHLLRMPDVAFLERQHLEFALKERRLPSSKPIPALLATHRFLSIDVERSEDGHGVAVVGRVSDGEHNDLATVTITSADGDVVDLAERLAAAVAEKLGKDASGSRLDREAEARRFTLAGNVEAAYALHPNGPRYRTRYMSVLSGRTHGGIPHYDLNLQRPIDRLPFQVEALERSLIYAQQSLELMREEVDHQITSPDWPSTFHGAPAGVLSVWLRKVLPAVSFLPSGSRREFSDFVGQYREFHESWGKELLKAAGTQDAVSEFNHWALHHLVDLQYIQVFLSDEGDRPFTEWTARWVGLLDRCPLDTDEQHLPEVNRILSLLWHQQKSRILVWSNRSERLRPAYDRIASGRCRLLRTYGRMFLVELDRETVRNPEFHRPFFVNPPPVDESIDQRTQGLIDESVEATTCCDLSNVTRKAWTDLLDHLVAGVSTDARAGAVEKVVKELWAHGVYGGRLPLTLMRQQQHSKDYDDAEKTIDRALAMLESGGTGMDPSDCRAEIARLVEQRKVFRKQSGRGAGGVTPWRSIETLYECIAPHKYSGIRYEKVAFRGIARPVVAGDDVYFLAFHFGGGADEAELVLMRRSLDGTNGEQLGSFPVRTRYPHGKVEQADEAAPHLECFGRATVNSPFGSAPVPDAAVAHGRYYLATMGCGLVVFPLDGSEPWSIDSSRGMPSDLVQRFVVHGDHIYAWLSRIPGEGMSHSYFVRIARDGELEEVICSSQRSTSKNLLDGTRLTPCHFMTLDAPRNRLILGIDSPASIDYRTIFQFDLQTATFAKLLDHDRLTNYRADRRLGDSILLSRSLAPVAANREWQTGKAVPALLSFDVTSETLTEVPSESLPAKRSWIILFRDKYFWMGAPFGRFDRQTGKFEPFPPLRSWEFSALARAIEIDETRILLRDSQSLWLVTLPRESAE